MTIPLDRNPPVPRSVVGNSEVLNNKACAFYQQAVLYFRYKEDVLLYTRV